MPRAATSVATRARVRPVVKSRSARSRWGCERPPWMATASTPARCRGAWRRDRPGAGCGRTRSSGPAALMASAARSTRSASAMRQKRWVASEMASPSTATSWRRRVALVAAHEHVDRTVERRREQQRLAVGPGLVEEPADLREEAHVGHAVGLVDHRDRDVVEAHVALVDEVGEPAGAGDEHVDALPQRLALRAEAHAAVDGGHPEAVRAGEEPQLTGDLAGELAGRHQHERGGAVGAGPLAAGHDREAEGQRLARAGGRLAGHVPAREGVGERRRLDGERARRCRGPRDPIRRRARRRDRRMKGNAQEPASSRQMPEADDGGGPVARTRTGATRKSSGPGPALHPTPSVGGAAPRSDVDVGSTAVRLDRLLARLHEVAVPEGREVQPVDRPGPPPRVRPPRAGACTGRPRPRTSRRGPRRPGSCRSR